LKLARKAGAAFALGTNHGGREDFGYLEYALEAQQAVDLTWQDFDVPGWKPSRAVHRP
jgi:hypothetical protein